MSPLDLVLGYREAVELTSPLPPGALAERLSGLLRSGPLDGWLRDGQV